MATEDLLIAALTTEGIRAFITAWRTPTKLAFISDEAAMDTDLILYWMKQNVIARYLTSIIIKDLKLRGRDAGLVQVQVDYVHILVSYPGKVFSIYYDQDDRLAWIFWFLQFCDAISAGVPKRWLTAKQALAMLFLVEEMHRLYTKKG